MIPGSVLLMHLENFKCRMGARRVSRIAKKTYVRNDSRHAFQIAAPG